MPELSLLICDDSVMARKQILRALPLDWAVSVIQAEHGQMAMDLLRRQPVDILFLDLTMPIMDGYQVLAAIRRESLPCKIVVVSGDVQDEAMRRVKELGALAFLKKPIDPCILRDTLIRLGLLGVAEALPSVQTRPSVPKVSFQDTFREVVNVAMGHAGALLAKVLNTFVQLPLPNVNILEVGELQMALTDAQNTERLKAVCQGYIAGGISGEALLIYHDSTVADMARLMHWRSSDSTQMELLLDLSCMLIGACLRSIALQLNLEFSQGHPQILGEQAPIDKLIQRNQSRWKKTLAVEISYSIEGHDIHFDLLLLFTEDSIPRLRQRLAYFMD